MDRANLPAAPGRQYRPDRLPDLRPPGLPGPGGEVREPVSPPRGGPHCAPVPALRDLRRLDQPGGRQHLHADWPLRAGRPGLQERDPDRRVRPRAGSRRQENPGRRDRGGAASSSAHPDDLLRLHHGRPPAGLFRGCGCRDAPCHGYRSLLRDARRYPLRPLSKARSSTRRSTS